MTISSLLRKLGNIGERLEGGELPADVPDLRASKRLQPAAPVYVKVGDANAGIVSDISEDGMALITALVLPPSDLLGTSIQLPGAEQWIEANSQVIWRSRSRKEAGVRFLALPEEARERIRSWMAAEIAGQQTASPADQQRASQDSLQNRSVRAPEAEAPPRSPDARRELPGSKTARTDALGFSEERSAKPDRRLHERRSIHSLAFARLDENSKGLIFNISEKGFAVTVALPLQGGTFPSARIQLPESNEWLDAGGRLAWTSDSKREAGIEFTTLSDEARLKIREWISSDKSTRGFQANPSAPKPAAKTAETRNAPEIEDWAGGHRNARPKAGSGRPKGLRHETPPLNPPASPIRAAGEFSTPFPARVAQKFAAFRRTPKGRGFEFPRVGHRILQGAVVFLVSAAIFALALVLAQKVSRVEPLETNGQTSRSSPPAANQSARSTPELPSTIESRTSADAESADTNQPEQEGDTAGESEAARSSKGSESVAAPGISDQRGFRPNRPSAASSETDGLAAKEVNKPGDSNLPTHAKPRHEEAKKESQPGVTAGRTESKLHSPPEKEPAQMEAERKPSQPVKTPAVSSPKESPEIRQNQTTQASQAMSPQPTGPGSSPQSSSPPRQAESSAGRSGETVRERNTETAAVPSRTQRFTPVTGAVSVSFNPYPSILMQRAGDSVNSRGGTSLQMGHVLSRVEPVYPEAAMQRGIQGTVRIHAVIGRDGTVAKIISASGDPALIPAATSAVREWRYSQTLVGGQAVETEEDFNVVFRLTNTNVGN